MRCMKSEYFVLNQTEDYRNNQKHKNVNERKKSPQTLRLQRFNNYF